MADHGMVRRLFRAENREWRNTTALWIEDMSEQRPAGWHYVAKTSEIEEDVPKALRIGDLFIALYKIADRYYATDDICTHEFAMLSEGYVDGDVIECPLHQARFHIPSGKVVGPPADKDLRTFAVQVVGEDVFVEIPEE